MIWPFSYFVILSLGYLHLFLKKMNKFKTHLADGNRPKRPFLIEFRAQ
mgnify:CR=1 FL=1